MTSRERVLLSFEHREPDRVPCWCGASPEFWEKAKQITERDDEGLRLRLGDDFRRIFAVYKGPDKGLSRGATWRSPFGVERMGIGYGQPLTHPLAAVQTEEDVLDFEWPNPDWVAVGGLRADASAFGGEYAVLGGDWSPFWHDVIDLLGMENLFYLMFDRPELASLIFKKVTDYYYAVSERIFETAADLIEGNEESVRQETLRILSIMSEGGGYVAGASHDYILPETPVENVLAMFDAIHDYRRD